MRHCRLFLEDKHEPRVLQVVKKMTHRISQRSYAQDLSCLS